jgi:hypothetical protein
MLIMRSTERAESRHGRLRLVASIAGIVVALDAVTKAIAAHALAGRGAVNLLGGHFPLELYRNFGARATFCAGIRARLSPKPDCRGTDPRRGVVSTHH